MFTRWVLDNGTNNDALLSTSFTEWVDSLVDSDLILVDVNWGEYNS
jgi:hypothetical protein